MYRYTPNVYRYTLAKNDQNPKCTGTGSRCTGTLHPKMPRMCIFSPFSYTFIHRSLLMHPSSKTNMESLPRTPQTLLICKKIHNFHTKFIPKSSIHTYFLDLGLNFSSLLLPFFLLYGFSPNLRPNLVFKSKIALGLVWPSKTHFWVSFIYLPFCPPSF